MTKQLGLQMYTLKDACAEDFTGTLRKVAEMGYDGVEFAGFYDTPISEIRALLDEIGMVAAGIHVGTDVLQNDLAAQIEAVKTLGAPNLLCPGFWGVDYNDITTFETMRDLFTRVGEACQSAGIGFAYHIHGHEFVKFDGKTGMDVLMEVDPALMQLEPDIYWLEKAGVRAVDFIEKHAERCTYIHLKEPKDRESWHDIEVGDGIFDIPTVIAAATSAEWLIIEQEAFERPPTDSAYISHDNVRRIMRHV